MTRNTANLLEWPSGAVRVRARSVFMRLTTLADIESAHELIYRVSSECGVVRTPLLPITDARFDHETGRRVWIKPENLQPTGAFKIRGAFHALSKLDDSVRKRGVVTYSSGNHARALAYAANVFEVPATVIVPHDAPAPKVREAEKLGAEIISVAVSERESVAEKVSQERGVRLIPPFDHLDIISGQGTAGLEIAHDLEPVDVVVVPVSGGGLISGVGTAIKALRPHASVIGVEPELAADTAESVRAGELVNWPVESRTRTAADGLTGQPSPLTFAHIRAVVDDVITVSETEIADGVRSLAENARIVAERSGAVAMAGLLHRAHDLPAGNTVVVVSGGNIAPADFAELVQPV